MGRSRRRLERLRPRTDALQTLDPTIPNHRTPTMTPDQPSHLPSRIESSSLYNPDLAPAQADRRHWGTYNFAALWVSMSVNILTYMLAASLIQGGMN